MNWNDAVKEAKKELGYYSGENIYDWDAVVKLAKEIYKKNRGFR